MDVVVADVNGGNAEVARDVSDVRVVEAPVPQSSETVENQQNTEENIKMDEQEINGDVKNVANKKSITPIARRKLRKSKANSTSAVDSDQEPKGKGQKRKLSEPDAIDSEDSMDFNGFDNSRKIIEPGVEILQKLIAEAEALEVQNVKRVRRSISKGPRRNIEHKFMDDHSGILDASDMKLRMDETMDTLEISKYRKESDKSDVESDDTQKHEDTSVRSPPNSSPLMAIQRQRGSVTGSKQKSPIDMLNPLFREPFKYGWKREIIYNGETENSSKKAIEVYYYTPKGKKVRSLREVAEFLNTKELTIDNFTFVKESTGINDPEYEIIREELKAVNSSGTGSLNTRKMGSVGKGGGMTRRLTGKMASPPSPPTKSTGKWSPIKSSTPGTFKVKVPGKRGSQKKSTSPPKETEVLSPMWNNATVVTRRNQASAEKTPSSYKTPKRSLKKKQPPPVEIDQRQYFMTTVCAGYNALSRVFQYLKVQELLRASRVCKMWRDIAAHPALWKTVRMKNSQVTDWKGLAASLQRHGTQHLDLRKMLIAGESDDALENFWGNFVSVIPSVTSLTKLELCRCPVMVVEKVIAACPQLEVICAMSMKCDWLNLESIDKLERCQELRLKAISGMSLHGDLTPLSQLTQLTHLSLTSVKELGKKKIEVLESLINLETLELGECSDFPSKFGTSVMCKLTKLERLRLEKGQGTCCTFDILNGVAKLEKLHQLELVNFDVKNGFDKRLVNCKNIKRLLIIPTYISQSATSNNMVLGGVTELSNNLTHFVWGVTLELLRVTELFVDQCNQMKKQVSGDSIPILKPVPCLKFIEDTAEENDSTEGEEKQMNSTSPQVDILPLPQLQKLLLTALPKTRVKILKIPFHATWRQSISDTSSQ